MTTVLLATMLLGGGSAPATATTEPSPGQLCIVKDDGKVGDLCPLERTSVVADISGFGARVTVTQVFKNPGTTTLEAEYFFPLPEEGAVQDLVLLVDGKELPGRVLHVWHGGRRTVADGVVRTAPLTEEVAR